VEPPSHPGRPDPLGGSRKKDRKNEREMAGEMERPSGEERQKKNEE
jgi:hypothetical protein